MISTSRLRLPAVLIGAFMSVALATVPARAARVQEITSPEA
jgi:hypothetical protein